MQDLPHPTVVALEGSKRPPRATLKRKPRLTTTKAKKPPKKPKWKFKKTELQKLDSSFSEKILVPSSALTMKDVPDGKLDLMKIIVLPCAGFTISKANS
jgi:hypothetical protein